MRKFTAAKAVATVLMLAAVAAMLTACGGKFTCDLCMQEKSGKRYETNYLGVKVTVCKDCYEGIKDMLGY